jgi:hypothetical protein
MKKAILTMAVGCIMLASFAACAEESKPAPAAQSSVTESKSSQAISSASTTDEEPVNAAQSSAPADDEPPINADEPASSTAFHIEHVEYDDGRLVADLIKFSGMEDTAVQDMLNDQIDMFCTWAGVHMGHKEYDITSVLEYTVIGDEYIFLRRTDTIHDGTDSPEKYFTSTAYELTTGEYAGTLVAFSEAGDNLREKITDGTFVQIYPAEPIEGAAELLAQEFDDSDFYFTEDSMGLYLINRPHEEGDYLIFEAKYEDIESLLAPGYFWDLLQK